MAIHSTYNLIYISKELNENQLNKLITLSERNEIREENLNWNVYLSFDVSSLGFPVTEDIKVVFSPTIKAANSPRPEPREAFKSPDLTAPAERTPHP